MFNEQKLNKIIEELKNKFANDITFTADVQELETYKNYGHPPQNFARFAEPDDEEWDEDEYYAVQLRQAIDYITADGLSEYTSCAPEEEKLYQPKVLEWLEQELDATGY